MENHSISNIDCEIASTVCARYYKGIAAHLDNIVLEVPEDKGSGDMEKEEPKKKKKVYRIRKLTPKECFRLQDVTDQDADKMLAVNSNSQCYKQAGNSICVSCLIALFSQLNIKGVKTWNEGLYKDLGYAE